MQIVSQSLRSQINREHLENLFAYNVSNEKNFMLRAVPLFLKNLAIRHVYRTSALANTTTVTNIGNIKQNLTCGILLSHQDNLYGKDAPL